MNGKPSERFNFTKKSLETLTSSGKDENYYDTKIPGLYLIVRAKGGKIFWCRGRLNGVQSKYRIGKFPDLSVENARNRVMEYKSKLANGQNPAEEKTRLMKDITFGHMARDFIENYAKHHKKSWKDDEAAIKNHLAHFVHKKASSITRNDVKDLHLKLGNQGPKTGANRILEKIRAIFNRAMDNGWKGENPAAKIEKFRERSRKRILSPDEIPNFFRALEVEHNRTVKDFVMIALFTGVRKNNVFSMKWKDVNLDLKMPLWTIEETKNGESHVVPLPPMIVEILQSRKKLVKNSPYVFPGDGKSGYYRDPKKAWARILKTAEINGLVIHDLRRTLATTISDNHVNQLTLQNILGHKTGSVTSIYARTQLKTILEVLTEVSECMIKEAGGIKKWWILKKE